MSKTPFKLLLAILLVEVGVLAAYFVSAEVSSRPDITFPVPELNNCKSETECRTYCNDPQNIDVCVDFAQKHGFISQEEAARAKQFKDVAQNGGPGGCKNQSQCESYCNDQTHMDECISFAEKHNLMSSDDLAEAKKVNHALRQGAKLPGNCQDKQQCETYCKSPDHAEECLDFASKAGFIPPDQVEQARKMLELVKSGDAPQACLAGKDQCQQYCSEETHRDQCANFMVKAGFMKPEDAEMFKKTGGKGPGNCQGKEECQAFCDAPENQETCFKFGEENGLIPPEQLQQMKEGIQKTKEAFDSAPPEVKQCLQSVIAPDVIQKIESGNFFPSRQNGEQLGEQMRKCFEQFLPKPGVGAPGEGGSMPPGQGGEDMPPTSNTRFRGPGGCSTIEECTKYCSDPTHQNECKSAGAPQPGNRQGGAPFPGSQGIPQNIQPYPSGQPAPMPIPSSGVQPNTSTLPPSSLVSKFFGEIIRFLITPQI